MGETEIIEDNLDERYTALSIFSQQKKMIYNTIIFLEMLSDREDIPEDIRKMAEELLGEYA